MKALIAILFVSLALTACTVKKDDAVPAQNDQQKTDTTGVQ